MRTCLLALATVFLLPVAGLAGLEAQASNSNWPSFRGRRAQGVQEGRPTPLRWNADSRGGRALENVVWKTPIPGLAHSSPVIWGDRLFVTTAVREAGEAFLKVGRYGQVRPVKDEGVHRFQVYCLDKRSGKVLWSRTAHRGAPAVQRHPKGSHAASTPATDGKHVVACFASEGLHCYDMTGKLLWRKRLGVFDCGFYSAPDAQWGYASSPVISAGRVILQVDIQKNSFLAAFDVRTGEEIWRTPRDEIPTWSTPTVYEHGGRRRIVVNGYRHIGAYDFATGEELWRHSGGGDIPVPTPVVGHGLVFITSAHGKRRPIFAISLDAKGTIDADESEGPMRWRKARRGVYLQTPLVYGAYLYCCSGRGVLTCYDARTGDEQYRERLKGDGSGFTSSPVASGGRIYVTGEQGEVHVVTAGPRFKVEAVNALGEICLATPAISDGTLFFRTRGHVLAVAAESKSD